MLRLLRRSSLQTRLAPCLESLEDRRLLSGLLSLGLGDALHSSSPSALTELVAAPMALLSPVTTTLQHLGGAVLSDLAPGVGSAPATAAVPTDVLGLHLNLNVDVLFVHLDQVHLNVSLAPIDSSQPLVSLRVGGTVALGGPTGGLLNVAPEVGLDLGGSKVVSLSVGSPGGVPSIPSLPAVGQTGAAVGSIVADLGGAGQGSLPAVLPSVISVPPTVNIVVPPNGIATAPASSNAVVLGGASSSSSATTTVVAEPVSGVLDGGAGATAVVDAPPQGAPLADNGGTGNPVAPPPVQHIDGGGGEVKATAADLTPEGSGLATRFQPDGVGPITQAIAAAAAAPQGGWLSAWFSRFAPYLGVLIAAGLGFDLERRRRLRRAAKVAARS